MDECEKFSSIPQPQTLHLLGLEFLESSRVCSHCVPGIYSSLYNVLGEGRSFTSTSVFLVFKRNRISLQEKNLREREGEEATEGTKAPAPFLLVTRPVYLSPCLRHGRESYLLAVGSLFYTSLARMKQFSSQQVSNPAAVMDTTTADHRYPNRYSLLTSSPTGRFICHLEINTHRAFEVIHRHAQSSKISESPHAYIPDEG